VLDLGLNGRPAHLGSLLMPSLQQPQAFKSGLNLLIFGAIMFAATAAAWCYWGHHFWTALHGPTEVALEDLAKLEDPKQLPSTWVKVTFKNMFKTDVAMEETKNGVSRIEEEYWILQAGDRWLIAGLPPTFKGQTVSGQIWHNNASLNRQAIEA